MMKGNQFWKKSWDGMVVATDNLKFERGLQLMAVGIV